MDRNEVVTIKKPSKCSVAELLDFAALVLAGGEVTPVGLDERVRKAENLVFLMQDGCLKGIAALKNPASTYRSGVFHKAQASVQAKEYPFELGWVFVIPSSRRRGLSHKLVQAALSITGGQGVFATSRSDNVPMHKVLTAHGFSKDRR